jgi:hypothetical protein
MHDPLRFLICKLYHAIYCTRDPLSLGLKLAEVSLDLKGRHGRRRKSGDGEEIAAEERGGGRVGMVQTVARALSSCRTVD